MQASPDLVDDTRGVTPSFDPAPLDPGSLARAKAAYTTRFVDAFRLGRGSEGFSLLAGDGIVPRRETSSWQRSARSGSTRGWS